MESFWVCFQAIMPLFLMMLLGYAAKWYHLIEAEDVPRMNRMTFQVFIPIMLFNSIYCSDLSSAIQVGVLVFAVTAVLVVYGLCVVYVLCREKDLQKRGVKIQGLYRSNIAVIGVPLATALLSGDIGTIAVMVAVIVPINNILAVITLTVFRGGDVPVKKMLLGILKNPMILGSLAGILFLVMEWRLPVVIESAVAQIAAANNPLMLFLLGAFFRFSGLSRNWRSVLEVCMGRLIVIPGVVLAIAYLAGIRGAAFVGLIGVFASATAIVSFTMTQQMGGDANLAGDIVVATSALCIPTIFLWSFLFKILGAF